MAAAQQDREQARQELAECRERNATLNGELTAIKAQLAELKQAGKGSAKK